MELGRGGEGKEIVLSVRGVVGFEFRESGALMDGFQTTRKKCHMIVWKGGRLEGEPSKCTKTHFVNRQNNQKFH
jgi:hypothetical protein